MHKEQDLILNSSVWKVVQKLSLPSIIGMLLVGLNSFIDAIFIGKMVGQHALIGTSMVIPLTQIQFGMGVMIGSGSGVLLSLFIGAKESDKQKLLWGGMLYNLLFFSLVTTFFTVYFTPYLCEFIGLKEENMAYGREYYKWYSLGSFVTIFGLAGNMVIRGEGKIKQSMKYSGLSFIINILLNPVFIKLFHMGVAGSALATIIAHTFLCMTFFYHYAKKSGSVIILSNIKFHFPTSLKILKIGFSGLAMSIISVIQGVAIFKLIGLFGTERDLLIYSVGNRASILFLMPAIALMRAMQPAIGINFGAAKYTRVKEIYEKFSKLSFYILTIGVFFLLIFRDIIFTISIGTTELNKEEITKYSILVLSLLFISPFYIGTSFFQSIGNGSFSTLLVLLRQIIIFIPLLFIFSKYFGIIGSFSAISITELLISIISLFACRNKLKVILSSS